MFDSLQSECGIPHPLTIPLHSNVQWGTAYHMLSVAYKLRQVRCYFLVKSLLLTSNKQPMNLFVASADHQYGPITMIRQDGQVAKHIPWSAFKFSNVDWERVREAAELLAVHESDLVLSN